LPEWRVVTAPGNGVRSVRSAPALEIAVLLALLPGLQRVLAAGFNGRRRALRGFLSRVVASLTMFPAELGEPAPVE